MKNKLIVIIGPTAAKKSFVALEIAKIIGGEIINADAFQVYREINAGVNKPSQPQLNEINHHLISFLSWKDEWNIALFQNHFKRIYQEILDNRKIPILCGGSHLYIDAVLKGYDLTDNSANKYINELSQWTNQELYDWVLKYDKISAIKIGLNNRKRLMRCAAIIKANNYQSKSILEKAKNNPEYNPLVIMVNQDRETLYQKINQRFEEMFYQKEWEQEVVNLIKQDQNVIQSQAFKALGYLDIALSFLRNEPIDFEKIKQKTRHLAKKQITWCNNKFPNKIVFDPTKDDLNQLIIKIRAFYEKD